MSALTGLCMPNDKSLSLISEMIDDNLSRGVRQLNGQYTQSTNRRYGVGRVFVPRVQYGHKWFQRKIVS